MKTNGNDLAHPVVFDDNEIAGGLTKREYFAAMALQGLLASGAGGDKIIRTAAAVEYANELIESLNEE